MNLDKYNLYGYKLEQLNLVDPNPDIVRDKKW